MADSVAHVVETFVADTIAENKPAIQAEVLVLWKTYGEPYDIPGVPDSVIDPIIEKALKAVVGPALDSLVARLRVAAAAIDETTPITPAA